MIFARIFNPNHVINLNKLTRSFQNIRSNELKHFPKWNSTTSNYPFLLKKLVLCPVMILFITDVDIWSRANLLNLKQTISPWNGITNVISTVIERTLFTYWCVTLDWFYLEKTTSSKQWIMKHKSDAFHPQNSFVRDAESIYTIVGEWKKLLLEYTYFYMRIKRNYASFKKKSFTMRWKPQLNTFP